MYPNKSVVPACQSHVADNAEAVARRDRDADGSAVVVADKAADDDGGRQKNCERPDSTIMTWHQKARNLSCAPIFIPSLFSLAGKLAQTITTSTKSPLARPSATAASRKVAP